MIEAANIIVIFMKAKDKLVVQSIKKRRSKKCHVLIKKRHIKGRKHVAPMNLAEYLNKLDILENSKVYYERFLRNRLHERHCCISKSRLE